MDVRLVYLVLGIAVLMAVGVGSRIGSFMRIAQITLAALVIPIVCRYHRSLYVILRTLPRDIKFLYRYVNADRDTKRYVRNNSTVIKIFRERAKLYPNKPCFIFEGRIWTNADMDKYSNRIASVFQKAGYVKGDAVALMMPNKPEFIATWLGLGKLGVVTALLNTNIRLQLLTHCLTTAKVKGIIYSTELSSAMDDIRESMPGMEWYSHGAGLNGPCPGSQNLDKLMSESSDEQPVVEQEPGYRDNLLYIFTSGTEGLPKAVQMPNSKLVTFDKTIITNKSFERNVRCETTIIVHSVESCNFRRFVKEKSFFDSMESSERNENPFLIFNIFLLLSKLIFRDFGFWIPNNNLRKYFSDIRSPNVPKKEKYEKEFRCIPTMQTSMS